MASGHLGKVESKLYQDSLIGENTDVELCFADCDDGTVVLHSHKLVLASQSNVFRVMLSEMWNSKELSENSNKIVLKLHGDDVEEFEDFMRCLYGYVPTTSEDCELVISSYRLADKYEALSVMDSCMSFFRMPGMAGKLVVRAEEYGMDNLRAILIDIVKRDLHIYSKRGASDWFMWNERILSDILGSDGISVFPNISKHSARRSQNEARLLELSLQWIDYQKGLNTEQDLVFRKKMNQELTVRILEKIRFRQLKLRDVQMSFKRLVGFLELGQIGSICLLLNGTSLEELDAYYLSRNKFSMDMRYRFTDTREILPVEVDLTEN